jgi:metallophosphoesterase (TIGR00282 family)
MRLVFFGDIVGKAGRTAYIDQLPEMRKRLRADLVVVNGENAAGGFGITEEIFRALLDAGTDVVTLGNHSWDQREALTFIEREPALLRPANYPPGTPGNGAGLFAAANGQQVLVMNVMGRIMMDPLDDPFAAVERELTACPLKDVCDACIIDMHAEATSEKMAMGHFADSRASLVVGTHTHVPTSDHHIMAGGTAYMSDAGMCGCYDSVIGMDKEEPLKRFLTKVPKNRFSPAEGPATISGVLVETDDATGLALKIAPIRVGGQLEPAWPDF